MKLAICTCVLTLLLMGPTCAGSVTLTFDDIPPGQSIRYYEQMYNIGFSFEFGAVDHLGWTWGPPISGTDVLAVQYAPSNRYSFMGFKNFRDPAHPRKFYASSIGGYFSTEPGVVLRMTGYHMGLVHGDAVASELIGVAGGSWDRVHVQLNSTSGIHEIKFEPVTTDALLHFCVDDMTIDFVPEPSSLLALLTGLGGFGMLLRRRGR